MGFLGSGAAVIGGALLGRSGHRNQEMPAAPKPEDVMDVVDTINGTQSITRVGANGKKQRVIERLPRTAQEEAIYREAGNIMTNTLRNIQNLYNVDPNAAMNYAPFVNTIQGLQQERSADVARLINMPDFAQFAQDFKTTEQANIREQFGEARNQTQSQLAGMGYGTDSTAWQNAQAAINAEESKASRGLDVRSKLAGQEYAQNELQNRIMGYTMGEHGRQDRQQSAATELGIQREQLNEREANRQRRVAEQAGLLQNAAAIRGEDANAAARTVAPQLQQDMYRNQLAAHGADVNAIMYNNANRAPTFGEIAGNTMGYFGGQGLQRAFDATAPRTNVVRPLDSYAPQANAGGRNANTGRFNMGFQDWLAPRRGNYLNI